MKVIGGKCGCPGCNGEDPQSREAWLRRGNKHGHGYSHGASYPKHKKLRRVLQGG